ncbi:MAG: DapH/DapD/GlmU-related protein [Dehalococcoidia bacterium]
MPDYSPPNGTLSDDLQDAYDTYVQNSFFEEPPEEPFWEHWQAKGERWGMMYLGMPFLAVALFRLRAHLLKDEVPLLPNLCQLVSLLFWNVWIGRYVTIGPRLVIAHGQVVIDGRVNIGADCVLSPWVTIGLSGSRRYGFDKRGPIIGDRVFVGTGAKVLGPITIGDDVRIGANAVVIEDVPSGATVVGAPARVVHERPPAWIEFEQQEVPS